MVLFIDVEKTIIWYLSCFRKIITLMKKYWRWWKKNRMLRKVSLNTGRENIQLMFTLHFLCRCQKSDVVLSIYWKTQTLNVRFYYSFFLGNCLVRGYNRRHIFTSKLLLNENVSFFPFIIIQRNFYTTPLFEFPFF